LARKATPRGGGGERGSAGRHEETVRKLSKVTNTPCPRSRVEKSPPGGKERSIFNPAKKRSPEPRKLSTLGGKIDLDREGCCTKGKKGKSGEK